MHPDRIELLKEDLYNHLFHLLDCQPDLDGLEAGRIATSVSGLLASELADEYRLDPTTEPDFVATLV